MILNKFTSYFAVKRLKTLTAPFLVFCLFSCSKTANTNANKAFVGVTHLAYGLGPIKVSINSELLFPEELIFGQTSGDTLNPYDTTVSQISDMAINLMPDSTPILAGNAAFQQNQHYSAFVFDSTNSIPLSLMIFQDNPTQRTDTNTNVRFLNFSPGAIRWWVVMVNLRTSRVVSLGPSSFVGYDENPGSYKFSIVRIGNYNAYAFRDSLTPAIDSSNVKKLGFVQIDSLRNYNLFLQGFSDSSVGQNQFQLHYFPLN